LNADISLIYYSITIVYSAILFGVLLFLDINEYLFIISLLGILLGLWQIKLSKISNIKEILPNFESEKKKLLSLIKQFCHMSLLDFYFQLFGKQ